MDAEGGKEIHGLMRRFILLALVAVLAAPLAAAAQEALSGEDERGDPASVVRALTAAEDAQRFRSGPAQSLIASAVYPGLGQLLNETEKKAAVVGGVEAFLIARLLLEDRWTRHSYRMYNETGRNVYFREYSKHFDARQTLLWWAAVAALYGIADAYVDAHLVGFDDLRPDLMDAWSDVPGAWDDTALRVGFACRF